MEGYLTPDEHTFKRVVAYFNKKGYYFSYPQKEYAENMKCVMEDDHRLYYSSEPYDFGAKTFKSFVDYYKQLNKYGILCVDKGS